MVTNPTNEELRRLKSLHRLTIPDIVDLLTSVKWGGPSESGVGSWLAVSKNNRMPANSLDLLKIRLDEAGFRED